MYCFIQLPEKYVDSRLRPRLICKTGFDQLKNPIMLIGLVLPRLHFVDINPDSRYSGKGVTDVMCARDTVTHAVAE
jgi:hypothetical protein